MLTDHKLVTVPYICSLNLVATGPIALLFVCPRYCEPRYSFPIQSETVARVVELAMQHHRMTPSTLFVCGTYTLGKFA
jgi:hypothetical protein